MKNAFEWCVSTTIFSQKKVGLITASASGEKAQEELALIMKTVEAKFSNETELLIQGIRGKVDDVGNITDNETLIKLINFINSFEEQLNF